MKYVKLLSVNLYVQYRNTEAWFSRPRKTTTPYSYLQKEGGVRDVTGLIRI